ncbi:unnamed protein product [Protopolystoma xenopodis]|uniref:Uncharacterized protein n=1 Tax=Protopolystoma xenopodis TaxID=117903 RepID=A0A3S5ANT2_9PLAT|nr:unnamed protein product [Protopolystoma xenopodis]
MRLGLQLHPFALATGRGRCGNNSTDWQNGRRRAGRLASKAPERGEGSDRKTAACSNLNSGPQSLTGAISDPANNPFGPDILSPFFTLSLFQLLSLSLELARSGQVRLGRVNCHQLTGSGAFFNQSRSVTTPSTHPRTHLVRVVSS